jgi:hypothetical protein
MEEEAIQNPIGTPNLSEAIEKLMAHPEIIEMAASVLGTSGAAPTPKPEPTVSEASDAPIASHGGLPNLFGLALPMLSGGSHKEKNPLAKSTALLIALKPYLSPSRCQTVDRLVEMSNLGTLFDRMKGERSEHSDVLEKP